MSVSLYFGLPGAGKTTMMVYHAMKGVRSKRYENVYCNVHIAVPGVTYIDNFCIGEFELINGLVLIDEATLFADNRDYKSFGKNKIEFFLEHRHDNLDIILYTQQWDGVDRKIRVITDRVYYVYKGKFLGHWFTRCYRIPYGIIIPDPKKSSSEKLGEIVQGYAKPPFLVRFFGLWLYRPKYYRYFDSWERIPRPPLPEKYKPYRLPEPDEAPTVLSDGSVLVPYFDKKGIVRYRVQRVDGLRYMRKYSRQKDGPEEGDARAERFA